MLHYGLDSVPHILGDACFLEISFHRAIMLENVSIDSTHKFWSTVRKLFTESNGSNLLHSSFSFLNQLRAAEHVVGFDNMLWNVKKSQDELHHQTGAILALGTVNKHRIPGFVGQHTKHATNFFLADLERVDGKA